MRRQAVASVGGRYGMRGDQWRRGYAEQRSTVRELRGAMPIAEQAVMPHAMEAGRQDVQEEPEGTAG